MREGRKKNEQKQTHQSKIKKKTKAMKSSNSFLMLMIEFWSISLCVCKAINISKCEKKYELYLHVIDGMRIRACRERIIPAVVFCLEFYTQKVN